MVKEFIIVFGVTYLGELLSKGLGLPIPGTVTGMILLFIFLMSGIIKIETIERASKVLLLNMAIFFIPPGVKLLESLDHLAGNWTKIIVLMVVTTVITMVVTGKVVDFLVTKGGQND